MCKSTILTTSFGYDSSATLRTMPDADASVAAYDLNTSTASISLGGDFTKFAAISLLRRLDHQRLPDIRPRPRLVRIDPALELRPEVRDDALDRPSRRIAERADRVAFDLGGDLEEHVDLALLGAA